MRTERSAGAVVFYRGAPIEYLLLLSTRWGFPKGHIQPGESERAAALREVREETGLQIALLDGFRRVDTYSFWRYAERVEKQSVYFLGEAFTRAVRISGEHNDLLWLPFEAAVARVDFARGKEILRQANEFLKSEGHT